MSLGSSMTTMKERIGNVIAWLGFSCLLVLVLAAVVVLWDANREKPKLIGRVACEDQEIKKYANLFTKNYQGYRCKRGATLYKWEYMEAAYGVVSWSNLGGYLDTASSNIDGYTHDVGREVAETTVPWASPLWLISLISNYILFGSARLLPWRKAVIREETS